MQNTHVQTHNAITNMSNKLLCTVQRLMQAYGWDSNYVNEQANAIMKGVAGSVKPSGPYLSLYTYNKINS